MRVPVIRSGTRIGVYHRVADHLRAYGHSYDVIVDGINTRPFFAPRYAPATPVVALAHQVAREVWFREMPLPIALAGRYVLEPRWLRRYRDIPTLTVSRSSRDSLRAYGLRDVTVVPIGVTLPGDPADGIVPDLPPVSDGLRLAFCGRLVPGKRPFDAVAAFRAAATELGLEPGVDAWLDVIGGGPLEGELRRTAGPGVVVHGVVDERTKFDLMARAHALLATSTREGWGLVVSEAAAAGTPTFGYDVGGLRDSVAAAGGVIVRPDPAALAAAVAAAAPRLMSAPPGPRPWAARRAGTTPLRTCSSTSSAPPAAGPWRPCLQPRRRRPPVPTSSTFASWIRLPPGTPRSSPDGDRHGGPRLAGPLR